MDYRAVKGNYLDEIIRQREIWTRKPILHEIYSRYFRAIKTHLAPGEPTIEIGGGSGRLKEELGTRVFSSDVFFTPWIDVQMDAHDLPFRGGSVRNIVAIDVLHHLPDPLRFFKEAARTLSTGGRITLVEPQISAWGFFVYRFLHHEPCDPHDAVWGSRPSSSDHNFANAALPWLVLERGRTQLEAEIPALRVRHTKYFDFIGYAASGGFNYRNMIPPTLIRWILRCEDLIPDPVMKHLTGLRFLAVLERT